MRSPKQTFGPWSGERDGLLPRVSECRLSLTSATPVTTSDVTAATILYLTEYEGNRISLPWNNAKSGNKWETFELPKKHNGVHEISQTFLANSNWALASGSNYDIFGFLDSTGPNIERGAAWSSDTARAVALGRDDTGRWVKAVDPSRMYLGTIRGSGTNTTEASAAKQFVWNFYNQRQRRLAATDATNTWTHVIPDQWNQANASSANQVALVVGDATAMMDLWALSNANMTGNPSGRMQVGIDQDGTSANDAEQRFRIDNASGTGAGGNATLQCAHMFRAVPLGYHYYAWVEKSEFTANWFGDGGSADLQSGLQGWVMG